MSDSHEEFFIQNPIRVVHDLRLPGDVPRFYVESTETWRSLAERHLTDEGVAGTLARSLLTLIEGYEHARTYREEAMDLLVEVVDREPMDDGYCVFCMEYVDFGGAHEADCLIARAKALLGTYRRAG